MALSPEAARLTESHRRSQTSLTAAFAVLMLRVWRASMRLDSIDTTFALWLAAVMPLVLAARTRSGALAAAYGNEFRRIELPAVDGAPFTASEAVNLAQIRASLTVTGPVAFKQRIKRGLDPAEALETSGAGAAAAAIRHVAQGGVDTLDEGIQADPLALGQARVTRGNCCAFCAMLASRGPVYKTDSFSSSNVRFSGPGNQKVHDSCGCSLEPVYHRGAPWPGRGEEFENLWISSTHGFSGKDALNAFRRAFEGANSG